jgi:hypothetical protein
MEREEVKGNRSACKRMSKKGVGYGFGNRMSPITLCKEIDILLIDLQICIRFIRC